MSFRGHGYGPLERPRLGGNGPSPLKPPIYLDAHATTPVDRNVLDAMLPYFSEVFGNPASRSHSFGWQAEEAVETARQAVGQLIGASPGEVTFTSGATEANNFVIKGLMAARGPTRDELITVVTEHASVLEPCRRLSASGLKVTFLPVKSDGLLDLNRLAEALSDRTLLVSVMWAQNEIGVIQPIPEIARLAHERGAWVHTDAVQLAAHLPIQVRSTEIDFLSLSAHKIYGPKGVGALYCRRGRGAPALVPQLDGGGQEGGLRAGTLNVPAIVGLGVAARIAQKCALSGETQLRGLRDRLWHRLSAELPGVRLNGSWEHRLPHNLNVSFEGVEGEQLHASLHDLAVSSGSACGSGARHPSPVLRALGVEEGLALATLRFGLLRTTTVEEIDHAADTVIRVVQSLRRRCVSDGVRFE